MRVVEKMRVANSPQAHPSANWRCDDCFGKPARTPLPIAPEKRGLPLRHPSPQAIREGQETSGGMRATTAGRPAHTGGARPEPE
jgi:hypothetical protein